MSAADTEQTDLRPEDEGDNGHDESASADASPQDSERRERSLIGFTYGDLADAEQIARELHVKWGGSASPEQLAASLNQVPKSGAFRTKVATARTMGIVDVTRGRVSLSPLGRRIIDPEQRADARVDAFLNVPLFKALTEEYGAYRLPPDTGLEKKIRELGVSVKQTAKARQAFQRSAEQAGFFAHGRDRLVRPAANRHDPDRSPESKHQDPPQDPEVNAGRSVVTGPVPPPVQDLWLTLLQEGRSWSAEKTQEFVETARKLHELLAKSG
jgi:hypothetical protein